MSLRPLHTNMAGVLFYVVGIDLIKYDFIFNVLLTYVIVYHYNETTVMHFSSILLRIKGLYMV
jgi:hypothetical protein